MHKDDMVIEPYDSEWPILFNREHELLISVIPIRIDAIHHIGSTSVPGLPAKPIIDILLEVSDIDILDSVNGSFESIGYECMGEFGIPGRRYYRRGKETRTHHIHAFKSGSIGARRHIVFRDYLRSHPEIAKEYANLKRSVAEASNGDMNAYCDGKADFVSKHEKLAIKWCECALQSPQ